MDDVLDRIYKRLHNTTDTIEILIDGDRFELQSIDKVTRFVKNQIVCDLYDLHERHGLDMNAIVTRHFLGRRGYDLRTLRRFYAATGYSLEGFLELQVNGDAVITFPA